MTNTQELKWLAAGLGLGITAGLLFAPKSGAYSRLYLQYKALEGTDLVKNQANSALNAAADAFAWGGSAIRHHKENVVAAVEAGQLAYREALATTPEMAS
jgi:gas vesicle protein